jgi:non-specific serine/threonine protein kinase
VIDQELPIEVTSFVGRRSERAQVRSQLSRAHLVTLTGVGGIGKTRLALKVASDLRRAFKDGLAFVPLAPHSEPQIVPHAVASALGLEPHSTKASTASLVEHLSHKAMLLVLDNCEHLIDEVAVLTDTLLRTCPNLRVLATSREPLRIQGESVHRVQPLSRPTGEALLESEAVQLLLDRARTVLGSFELADDNRDAIARIATKLEGIPLALELAASRLRAISPVELDADLTDSWATLTQGDRTAPDRQRTMAHCIEWSFRLCTPVEQALWARLAVFNDGFDLEAAREVCADVPAVADELLSLVTKSIVLSTTHGPRSRFRMLPPIRERGLKELRRLGLWGEIRLRHRDWCARMTERMSEQWLSDQQSTVLARMRDELPNIQTALETCLLMPGQAESGLRMGANLLEFGISAGFFRRGRYYLDRLLDMTPEPTEARALALRAVCWWATMQGDLSTAAELLEEGREIANGLAGRTQTLLAQAAAFVAMFSDENDVAALQLESVIEALTCDGDDAQLAHSLALSALNHTFRGDVEAAFQAHRRCLRLTESSGDSWYRSFSLSAAGLAAWIGGDSAGAATLEKESLRLKRDTGNVLGLGVSLEAIAWIASTADPERSARLLGAAQTIWRRIDTSMEALPRLGPHHVTCVHQLTAMLGCDKLESLIEEGRSMSTSDAIDLALEENLRPPKPRDMTPEIVSPLTRREKQVAGLVAKGMTNREIADCLVISKRTTETHVLHILTKLGFNNRGQISDWVREQRSA